MEDEDEEKLLRLVERQILGKPLYISTAPRGIKELMGSSEYTLSKLARQLMDLQFLSASALEVPGTHQLCRSIAGALRRADRYYSCRGFTEYADRDRVDWTSDETIPAKYKKHWNKSDPSYF